MISEIESCWRCGAPPIVVERESLYGIEKRFACPNCLHKSTSYRELRKDALLIWNRTARSMQTKLKKEERNF